METHENIIDAASESPLAPAPFAIPFSRSTLLLNLVLAPLVAVVAVLVILFGILMAIILAVDLQVIPRTLSFGLRLGYTALFYLGCGRLVGSRGPALVLTEEHLDDRSGPAAAGVIPWNTIVSAYPADILMHRGVALHVNDPDDLLLHASGLRHVLMQCNYNLLGTPVHIPIENTTISTDDLLDRIYARVAIEKAQHRASPPADGPLRAGSPFAPRQEYLVPYVENPAGRNANP